MNRWENKQIPKKIVYEDVGYDQYHDVNVYACICPSCGLHIIRFDDSDIEKCDSDYPKFFSFCRNFADACHEWSGNHQCGNLYYAGAEYRFLRHGYFVQYGRYQDGKAGGGNAFKLQCTGGFGHGYESV